MRELDTINTLLGGHKTTIEGFSQLAQGFKQQLNICEVGCGGGDNLRILKKWCEENAVNATFSGIDINPQTIDFAKNRRENKGIDFVCCDYRDAKFNKKPDIIFSSLFCHHFTDEELHELLKWCKANAAIGFFMNDLHRHPAAYYSIKLLTHLFSKSSLVKNDGPLSVLRSFRKNEWKKYLNRANIVQYCIRWKWAFRWLIIVRNNGTLAE